MYGTGTYSTINHTGTYSTMYKLRELYINTICFLKDINAQRNCTHIYNTVQRHNYTKYIEHLKTALCTVQYRCIFNQKCTANNNNWSCRQYSLIISTRMYIYSICIVDYTIVKNTVNQ